MYQAKMLNIVQVPIRENLSVEDFERDFASQSTPVVLRGAASHWLMTQWPDTRAGIRDICGNLNMSKVLN